MPDIVVRHIDEAMAERIKAIARSHGWTLNEAVLHLLRQGLGLVGADHGGEAPPRHEPHDIARLSGTWEPQESAAFRAALEALQNMDGDPLPAAVPKARDPQKPA